MAVWVEVELLWQYGWGSRDFGSSRFPFQVFSEGIRIVGLRTPCATPLSCFDTFSLSRSVTLSLSVTLALALCHSCSGSVSLVSWSWQLGL